MPTAPRLRNKPLWPLPSVQCGTRQVTVPSLQYSTSHSGQSTSKWGMIRQPHYGAHHRVPRVQSSRSQREQNIKNQSAQSAKYWCITINLSTMKCPWVWLTDARFRNCRKEAPGKDQTMKKAARRRQSLICCVKLPEAKKTYCVPNLL